jgi:hypothetical protein
MFYVTLLKLSIIKIEESHEILDNLEITYCNAVMP